MTTEYLLNELNASVKRGNRIGKQIRFTITSVIFFSVFVVCAAFFATIPGAEPEARMGQITLAVPASIVLMTMFLAVRGVLTWTE